MSPLEEKGSSTTAINAEAAVAGVRRETAPAPKLLISKHYRNEPGIGPANSDGYFLNTALYT